MLKVRIIDPDRVVYQGEAEIVFAPGVKGYLGIMPGHTAMFAELIKGDITIKGQKQELVAIESGILRVKDDDLLILVGLS